MGEWEEGEGRNRHLFSATAILFVMDTIELCSTWADLLSKCKHTQCGSAVAISNNAIVSLLLASHNTSFITCVSHCSRWFVTLFFYLSLSRSVYLFSSNCCSYSHSKYDMNHLVRNFHHFQHQMNAAKSVPHQITFDPMDFKHSETEWTGANKKCER